MQTTKSVRPRGLNLETGRDGIRHLDAKPGPSSPPLPTQSPAARTVVKSGSQANTYVSKYPVLGTGLKASLGYIALGQEDAIKSGLSVHGSGCRDEALKLSSTMSQAFEAWCR